MHNYLWQEASTSGKRGNAAAGSGCTLNPRRHRAVSLVPREIRRRPLHKSTFIFIAILYLRRLTHLIVQLFP
jgi:hypothetical protein